MIQIQQIPQTINDQILNLNPNISEAIFIFCFAGLIYFLKKEFFRRFIKKFIESTKTSLDNELYPLINRIISLLIWGIAIILILPKLGINVKALIATLGASSIIIAYGFKNSFTNIISGLIIMTYRPFRIGDSIKLSSGEEVKVIDIGGSLSKFYIKDKKEGILFIPNSDLVKSKIINYTYVKELKEKRSYV